MKKLKLTLASSKDKKPTISASQLLEHHKILIIGFEGFTEIFYPSRDGETYYAQSWSKKNPLPKVGKPIELNIKSIIELKQYELL